jgi:hypothetical protein
MPIPWIRRKRALVGLSAVLLLIGLGGIAYATIPDSEGVIHGCYRKSTGSLRVIDTDAGETCSSAEKPVSWNQTGPTGPTGPSDAWDAQPVGTVPTGGEDTELNGGVTDLPPGSYLLTGSVTWPPLNAGSASLLCNLQASGTDLTGSTSGGFGTASTEGGGTVSMAGAITVNSGTANLMVVCRQLSGTEIVFAQARVQAIRVGTLH